MYSALNHKWQLGPVVPSYCPQRTQFTTAARALPYSCVDTNDPRSPETVRLTGVTGMGYVAIVFWICCWVNGIFLRSVSGFSGKTGQPSAGNFWSLGDSDLLAWATVRGACCPWRLWATTSHINNLALADHSGRIHLWIWIWIVRKCCFHLPSYMCVCSRGVSVCKHTSFCHMLSLVCTWNWNSFSKHKIQYTGSQCYPEKTKYQWNSMKSCLVPQFWGQAICVIQYFISRGCLLSECSADYR